MDIQKIYFKKINKINSHLENFYNKGIINQKEVEASFKRSFYGLFENYTIKKNKYIQFFCDIKIVTEEDIGIKTVVKDYSVDYQVNMKNYNNVSAEKNFKVIYTNGKSKKISDFDYSKVYIILDENENLSTDFNYNYLIKENLYYLYIPPIK